MFVCCSFQLEHKLVSVPEKKQHNETLLDKERRKLNAIEELAPVRSNVSSKNLLICFLQLGLQAPGKFC